MKWANIAQCLAVPKKKIESNNNFNSILKRLRHEYFAVLGQFCAKSIIYCL